MDRAVFIDRDNTLIANDGDLGDPSLVRLMPGVGEAISILRGAGFRLVVVTNQGGVARGRYSEDDVQAVHLRLDALLRDAARVADDRAVDLYLHCPYHPDGSVHAYRREHPWRKPSPGMLLAARDALDLDLSRSWLVGDAERDVEAGRRAGCRTIRVGPDAHGPSSADCVCDDLLAAARVIVDADVAADAAGHRGRRDG